MERYSGQESGIPASENKVKQEDQRLTCQESGIPAIENKVKQEDQLLTYENSPYMSSSFVEVSMGEADRSYLNENMKFRRKSETNANSKTGLQDHVSLQSKPLFSSFIPTASPVSYLDGQASHQFPVTHSYCGHLDNIWPIMDQPKGVPSMLFRSWQNHLDQKVREENLEPKETDGRRKRRTTVQKESVLQRQTTESAEQRESRLKKNRVEAQRKRYNETQEERVKRLARLQNYSRNRIMNESEVERAIRLSRMRHNEKKRRLSESQVQRQLRLRRLRENDKKRRSHESEEQRQRRLSKMKENYRKRKDEKKVEVLA